MGKKYIKLAQESDSDDSEEEVPQLVGADDSEDDDKSLEYEELDSDIEIAAREDDHTGDGSNIINA